MLLKWYLNDLWLRFNKWRLSLINRFAYGSADLKIMSDATEPPIRTGGGTLP